MVEMLRDSQPGRTEGVVRTVNSTMSVGGPRTSNSCRVPETTKPLGTRGTDEYSVLTLTRRTVVYPLWGLEELL